MNLRWEKKNVFLIIFNNLKDVSLLLFDAPKKRKKIFFPTLCKHVIKSVSLVS